MSATKNKLRDPRIGAWVRFYRGGEIVIGVVEYVQEPDRSWHADKLCTTAGCVDADQVLEIRKATPRSRPTRRTK